MITVLGILCLILFVTLIAITCKWYYMFPYFSKICPDEWIGYDGKCYYFSINKTNWNDSKKLCDSMNSSVIIFDNVKTLNFVSRYGTGQYWVGINQSRDIPGISVLTSYKPYIANCLLFYEVYIMDEFCTYNEKTICVKEDKYTHWYNTYMLRS